MLHKNIGNNQLILEIGDITQQKTDAIVNAAKSKLLGGGGVDGAIHRNAGSELLEACKRIRENELEGAELETGNAVITDGYDLPARFVIHTVGTIWNGEEGEMTKLLSSCYKNTMLIALKNELTSISFPSISTGVYRFPIELAAKPAIDTIVSLFAQYDYGPVCFVLFLVADYDVYVDALLFIC